MNTYHYMVTVEAETAAQAEQVMTERIDFTEELNSDADGNEYPAGFDYTIDYGPLP